MLPPPFVTPTGSADAFGRHSPSWKQIGAELAIFFCFLAIAAAGGLLGYLVGAPKAFFIIMMATVLWIVGASFLAGWRVALMPLSP